MCITDRRLKLQQLLEDILESENVYFQPPANFLMEYPCIVYHLDNLDTKHADNKPYLQTDRYLVTSIARSPTSVVPRKIGALPLSAFSRFFVSDGLNHTAYTLYF